MLRELAFQTFAHDEAKCLQDAAYTVFQSRDLRHQLGARYQQRPNGLAVKALFGRMVVIRLVDLER